MKKLIILTMLSLLLLTLLSCSMTNKVPDDDVYHNLTEQTYNANIFFSVGDPFFNPYFYTTYSFYHPFTLCRYWGWGGGPGNYNPWFTPWFPYWYYPPNWWWYGSTNYHPINYHPRHYLSGGSTVPRNGNHSTPTFVKPLHNNSNIRQPINIHHETRPIRPVRYNYKPPTYYNRTVPTNRNYNVQPKPKRVAPPHNVNRNQPVNKNKNN